VKSAACAEIALVARIAADISDFIVPFSILSSLDFCCSG
jgi:hypothetical protein